MNISEFVDKTEAKCRAQFARIDETAYKNQKKVLDSFRTHKIALRHFAPTSGYGYDDVGRDTLNALYADVLDAEKAVVSPLIASGTHALTVALFAVLRPGDTMLSVTGEPYDTLHDVIDGKGIGSLREFGIRFESVDLKNDRIDSDAVKAAVKKLNPQWIFIQRSRGYNWRDALSIDEIAGAIADIRRYADCPVMVDNCYGEFVETVEPCAVGADLVAGSLIKNIGGGLAPTGGYVAGKAAYVDQAAYRLIAPGIGTEVGSYAAGYRLFYQGLFLAPHITAQAIKTSVLFGAAFSSLGYETMPAPDTDCKDIIRSIRFRTPEEVIAFCQAVQYSSPVDSFAVPEPWDMPGYDAPVIMAAGAFVQGASIELSADSPIRPPYVAYLQGGLTYEHGKIALAECLARIVNKE